MVDFRIASIADVASMAACRLADPAAGPADERIAAYLQGKHDPQQALPPRIGFVAIDGKEVVGYIAGHLTRRYDCEGEVQYLFVAPSHRRVGVAGELLSRLADWFARQDAHRICVNVAPANAPARRFYARNGAHEFNKYWFIWSDIHGVARGAA